MTEILRAKYARQDVQNYQQEGEEAWKLAHNQSMVCFEIEELTRTGNQIFEAINRLDEWFQTLLFDKKVSYSDEMRSIVTELLESWLMPSNKVLSLFEKCQNDYQSRGFDLNPVRLLEGNVRECTSMLLPTVESLQSEYLITLRDKAIDDLYAGTTHDLEGFSN